MTETTVTERETKRADELKPGDWIAAGPYNDRIDGTDDAEVLHTHPYADGRKVAVMIQEATIPEPEIIHLYAEGELTLLTAEEIAGHREGAERAQFAAGLREFADWVEANPWAPIKRDGGYLQTVRLQVDLHAVAEDAGAGAVARVREIADRLGVKVDESLDDRTDASAEIGSASYSVIAWHRDGRPAEPAPPADPDPAGLGYSRTDDDPQPVAGRVPPHLENGRSAVVDTSEPVTWHFSFGHGQYSAAGEHLIDKYVTVVGPTPEVCREAMIAAYGQKWSSDYAPDSPTWQEYGPQWAEHARIDATRLPGCSGECIDDPERVGHLDDCPRGVAVTSQVPAGDLPR